MPSCLLPAHNYPTMPKTPESNTLHLRLVCIDPPLTVWTPDEAGFGLQDKRETLHPGGLQPDGSLIFTCTVQVRPRQGDAPPDFAGPFVHGPRGDRFLYLSLRGADSKWVKRLKIPLAGIPWAEIGKAHLQRGGVTATVSGAGSARTEQRQGWSAYAG